MLEKLRDKFKFPSWADARYRRLAFLDSALSMDFYKELRQSFYDDAGVVGSGRRGKLTERKPSVRYHLSAQVARQTARKLFSGRHAPRFTHPSNKKMVLAAESLMREGFLKTRILQAAVWGSVGSVAVTFTILPGGEKIPRIIFNVYRARMCTPTIDSLGELKGLRLWYPISWTEASKLAPKDFAGNAFKKDTQYWFVRDFLPGREVTYVPVELGTKKDDLELDKVIQIYDGLTPAPKLDFNFEPAIVPAHWFVNLSGGEFPDGACTWEDALPGMIEIDYTLSNLGRGVRYNSTPQVVVIGDLKRQSERLAQGESRVGRDAGDVLHLAGQVDGQQTKKGAGDAKLLEMRGSATAASLKYVEAVRKYSLEQIGASRKDPDRLHFPQSGKAMELLDEDFFDLVGELRTSYGDYGLIPLMKKALTVAEKAKHPLLEGVNLGNLDELALKWPRPYLPTAQEFQLYMQGLVLGVTGKTAATAGTGDGAAAPTAAPGILTREEAHRMLDDFMDVEPEVAPIALQQHPREEITLTSEPAQGTPPPAGDPAVAPSNGSDPPQIATRLAPRPYRQQ